MNIIKLIVQYQKIQYQSKDLTEFIKTYYKMRITQKEKCDIPEVNEFLYEFMRKNG